MSNAHPGPRRGLEGAGVGATGREGPFPERLEVDRIGENQHGLQDMARLEQVLDPVSGLLLDPGVDGLPRLFGCGAEVDRVDASSVVHLDALAEVGEDRLARLDPECIGHEELDIRGLGGPRQGGRPADQVGDQPMKLPMERAGGQVEVEGLGHLTGRLALGPGVGHRQGRGDRHRREDAIAIAPAQPGVEAQGERVVAAHEGVELAVVLHRRGLEWERECRDEQRRGDDRHGRVSESDRRRTVAARWMGSGLPEFRTG